MSKTEYTPNILHILDEFERINKLIAANIPYILEEKDKQKSVDEVPFNTQSLKDFEKTVKITADNIVDKSKKKSVKGSSETLSPLNSQFSEEIKKLISSGTSDFNEKLKEKLPSNPPPFGIPLWATKKFEQPRLKVEIDELRKKIDIKIENSAETRRDLRLLKLKQLFNLSPEEIDIFLICLIGEFDTHYQAMWKDLQNDHSQKYPSIEIILNLLSSNLSEKLKLRAFLQNDSKLFKYCLLEYTDIKLSLSGITHNHTVKVAPRIFNYLLDDNSVLASLSYILKFKTPSEEMNNLSLSGDLMNQIEVFTDNYRASLSLEKSYIITLQGKEGSGRQIIAESICQKLNINMLIVHTDALLVNQLKELPLILSLIRREAILQNTAVYWQNIHLLNTSDKSVYLSLFINQLEQFQGLHFFALKPYEYFPFQQIRSILIHLKIPNFSINERLGLWRWVIPELPIEDIAEIARSFHFGLGQIYDIAAHIRALFKEEGAILSKKDIYRVCHTHANQYLSKYTKLAKPFYQLDNVVLPKECKQELEEIIAWTKYKETVYEKGGFNKKISLGKGLIALFFGPPGTGKTMAAEVIANSLNLLLYKIDLSSVLSKYVGETEQHLDKVFDGAENSNAILFFDEADSLFGKRGEVKDARDNYANIQTSYLLQKVEEYPGIAILATNFKHNMDEAFIRRLHFSIEFPFPKPEERLRIWQQIWPESILLDNEIDLQKLANKLDIAGGNIRNIALSAAFKAAAEQKIESKSIKITKDQLTFTIKREFRKIGRIIMHEQLDNLFK